MISLLVILKTLVLIMFELRSETHQREEFLKETRDSVQTQYGIRNPILRLARLI